MVVNDLTLLFMQQKTGYLADFYNYICVVKLNFFNNLLMMIILFDLFNILFQKIFYKLSNIFIFFLKKINK